MFCVPKIPNCSPEQQVKVNLVKPIFGQSEVCALCYIVQDKGGHNQQCKFMPQLLGGKANLVAQSCQVGSSDVPAMPVPILMSVYGSFYTWYNYNYKIHNYQTNIYNKRFYI